MGEIADDIVLYSQNSVITDDGTKALQNSDVIVEACILESQPSQVMVEGVNSDIMETGQEKVIPERRSDRLKKDAHLTTMQKNEAMASKRALEGNSSKAQAHPPSKNSSVQTIVQSLGVSAHTVDFGAFDLFKDIETVKNNLIAKHQSLKSVSEKPEIVEFVPEFESEINEVDDGDDSDIQILLSQQHRDKKRKDIKKLKSPQGGESKT